ncbi:MAG: type IV secretion system DNA-binding domain-containing protein [Patescibacteria group bacterium]|nr:type IV secretion system DNA-binding domain-containing protein [Patescibacteria group bacterium]
MSEYSNIKKVSPPAELPTYQEENGDITFFGNTTFKEAYIERKDVFGIWRFDRRQHIYIIGKTGVGKTKLIELLTRADILDGFGVCVIDPHGDLINSLLDYIPEGRLKDVVLIDPTDTNFPVAFNPLKKVAPEARQLVASGLLEVFRKQFGDLWTSRLEHVCRFTILALLEYEEATLADISKMLTNPKFRQEVIPRISDSVVRHFWSLEFNSWSERFDNEAIIPLVNRMGQFLANPLVRNTFAQKENKINFDELINSSKIILVNLSKGIIGEDNTELFGSILITSIYQAAMRRAKIPSSERSDFYLYVDEFQNVATQTFLNLFAESRKYGLNITVSHQYLGQVTPKMRDTIFGNTGTIISFRLGGEDAERLNKEFAPVCKEEDLINLGQREFVIKLLIAGNSYDPFAGETLEVEATKTSHKDQIINYSRSKYSRPINELEQEMAEGGAAEKKEDFIAPVV